MSEKKATPAHGDEVFDIHGRAATYLALGADGHVVQPIYEHEDYAPSYGNPEVWRDAFTTPPTQKLHAEVAEIETKLNAARQALHEVQEQRRTEDREYAARANERKRFDQLKKLDDYIAGKITHFVVVQGYGERLSIQEFETFICSNENRYERKLRLLSLFGDSKGELNWYIDRYSDGSGGDHGLCFPATSYEDALAVAANWLAKRYADIRKSDKKYEAYTFADAAARLGLTVPDDIAAWAKEVHDSARASSLKSARAEFEKAQARLREMEADQ